MSDRPCLHIAFVHPGCELYGADRSLVETVAAVAKGSPGARIDAAIPGDGPLAGPLAEAGATVVREPLWVLRERSLSLQLAAGAVRFVPALLRAVRRFRGADLVYINSASVIDHLIAARFFPGRAVVHVHEAPSGWTLRLMKALLGWSRAELVFNSRASEAAFGFGPDRRAHVVYDAVPDPGDREPAAYDPARRLRVLVIGRISRNKGQEVAVDALGRIAPALRDRLEMRIVGGGHEDEEIERALAGRIREAGLVETVAMLPFASDPGEHYRWADLVLVPARTTEALGRVAIDAMANGRPALVSALGGLKEIVEGGRTGWFVRPDDPDALAARLTEIVSNPDAWARFGAAARERYERHFSGRVADERIRQIVRSRIGAAALPAAPLVEA